MFANCVGHAGWAYEQLEASHAAELMEQVEKTEALQKQLDALQGKGQSQDVEAALVTLGRGSLAHARTRRSCPSAPH